MRKSRVDQRFRKRLYKRGLRPILITRLLIQGMGGLPTPSLFQRHRPKYRDLAGRRIVRSDLHPEFFARWTARSAERRSVPTSEAARLFAVPKNSVHIAGGDDLAGWAADCLHGLTAHTLGGRESERYAHYFGMRAPLS